ncbi:four helix bundle protein [Arcicella rosea]|uniref:Four helix bundle protein n=1 Tax=Arcicella rosea TaxID=502909 RepID=A0A841ERC6_9BACT|nr:four helix bundle protein [Arcicella rosea]MBB6003228.1 four helix bundle protein [Arcicella rosea]
MQNYKDLKVWQKSHLKVLKVYQLTNNFPKNEIYGLVSQYRRSAVSVSANLVEGCGKFTSNDIANFFQVALGSLHETEYYNLLSRDLAYISEHDYKLMDEQLREIKAMLIALIKTVRNK